MIDPHELRIGNWVEAYIVMISGSWYDKEGRQYGHNVITEPPIRHKQIDVEDLRIIINSKGLATYRAIPLTPEILEKCGFEWITDWTIRGNDGVVYRKDLGWFRLETGMMGYLVILVDKDGKSCGTSCEFLHQLQNLYFALTGTELNYSPDNKN